LTEGRARGESYYRYAWLIMNIAWVQKVIGKIPTQEKKTYHAFFSE